MLLMFESEETGLSDLNQCNSQFLIKAPSKRIRVFLNPQLFLSGLKNFHVHSYPTPIRIYSSTQDSCRNIGHRACVEVAILKTVLIKIFNN